MFARAEQFDVERGGRFDRRSACVLIWSTTAAAADGGEPIGGVLVRWHDPTDELGDGLEGRLLARVLSHPIARPAVPQLVPHERTVPPDARPTPSDRRVRRLIPAGCPRRPG